MNDAIRNLLCKRVEKRWRAYTSQSFFPKLARLILPGGPTPIAIFLIEHGDADWSSGACTGVAIRAWKRDDLGLVEISPSEIDPGEVKGQYWQRQLMRFHVSPDSRRVLWNDIEGPKRGQLILFSVSGTEEEPKLKVEKAALCL